VLGLETGGRQLELLDAVLDVLVELEAVAVEP
jgi:hypothetical protein